MSNVGQCGIDRALSWPFASGAAPTPAQGDDDEIEILAVVV